MTPTTSAQVMENTTKKRAATIICALLLLSGLMALSSVILVAEKRTSSRNSSRALEKRGSGTQSAFRFLDSVKGKKKASVKKRFVDVVEDDQMGDLIVVKEEDQEEKGL